jgi:hypothetical protein
MFGLPKRAKVSAEQRTQAQDYLRDILPLVEKLDEEYRSWMEIATEDSHTLGLDRDPEGQHASVYLWRVSEAATELVQRDPPKAARRWHDAMSLCLENRGAAADLFRDAATLAALKDPGAKISEANKRLVDGQKHRTRAQTAQKQLEARFGVH